MEIEGTLGLLPWPNITLRRSNMPFKNPFYFSKRALDKIGRVREQQTKELHDGPNQPPKVNNFKTNNKSIVGKSLNVYTPIDEKQTDGEKAPHINNFEVNKPVVAKSLNEQPAQTIKKRDVQDVIPAVNGKAAPQLVHKPALKNRRQDFFPVVEQGKKTNKKRRTTKKSPKKKST